MNLKTFPHETLRVGLFEVIVDHLRTLVQEARELLVGMRDERALGPT